MLAVVIVAGLFLVIALLVVALIWWLDVRGGSLTELHLELQAGRWFKVGTRVLRDGGRNGVADGQSSLGEQADTTG